MDANKIWITVLLAPDEDFPIADIMYSGVEWASATQVDGELSITLYPTTTPVPLEAAILSLEEARRRLSDPPEAGEPSE